MLKAVADSNAADAVADVVVFVVVVAAAVVVVADGAAVGRVPQLTKLCFWVL